jgi:micrococcal nuclease
MRAGIGAGWQGAVTALALLAAACAPDLRGLEPGEMVHVNAATSGGTILLADGRRVILAELEPIARDAPLAREARGALEALTVGRTVQLAFGGLRSLPAREGQPETLVAHVFAKRESGAWVWVQEALVSEGLALVRPRRDNAARTPDLLRAERSARAASLGVWRDPAGRVRSVEDLILEAAVLPERCADGPYLVVRGVIDHVAVTDRSVYLNFGPAGDEARDPTLRVDPRDAGLWLALGLTPQRYAGQSVEARGKASARGGALLCIEHPAAITILADR